MKKTDRELAFIRDLVIEPDWTRRFTQLFDKHFDIADAEKILYINPGTGSHAIEIRSRLGEDVLFRTFSIDVESNEIARGKTEVVEADIEFASEFPRDDFDLVIADASFVKPDDLTEFVQDAVDAAEHRVAIMVPTAGSFGEIFSLMWECFTTSEFSDLAHEAERLISSLPQVSDLEVLLKKLGLSRIRSHTSNEAFDFATGAEFIEAPLIADFLLPAWTENMDEEERLKLSAALADLIAEENEDLAFRFTVKATLLTGEKA
jgi:hypothetical protein